jgi:hypothetical protein
MVIACRRVIWRKREFDNHIQRIYLYSREIMSRQAEKIMRGDSFRVQASVQKLDWMLRCPGKLGQAPQRTECSSNARSSITEKTFFFQRYLADSVKKVPENICHCTWKNRQASGSPCWSMTDGQSFHRSIHCTLCVARPTFFTFCIVTSVASRKLTTSAINFSKATIMDRKLLEPRDCLINEMLIASS